MHFHSSDSVNCNIHSAVIIYSCVFQVGPGVVFLLFNHSFLGRGVIVHCVTPVEPLLQCVSHTIFYQSNIPPLVPKFILRVECVQVSYTSACSCHCDKVSYGQNFLQCFKCCSSGANSESTVIMENK